MAYNIMSRQVWKLMERGYDIEDAKRIAYTQQLKNGNIIPGSRQLTEKGKEYSWIHPNDRAKLRKQKYNENRKIKRQQNKILNGMLK